VEPIDILIKNGWVLTMDPRDTLIERGAVAVSADRIVEIGTEDALTASYKAAKTIDAQEGIIMPGLVNAHTHAAMTCFRGLADDLPLMMCLILSIRGLALPVPR
jgi:5-methylthioadenosine/S-adenosylhomocysteine deaminase